MPHVDCAHLVPQVEGGSQPCCRCRAVASFATRSASTPSLCRRSKEVVGQAAGAAQAHHMPCAQPAHPIVMVPQIERGGSAAAATPSPRMSCGQPAHTSCRRSKEADSHAAAALRIACHALSLRTLS